MAAFNGKWILTKVDNAEAFYDAVSEYDKYGYLYVS